MSDGEGLASLSLTVLLTAAASAAAAAAAAAAATMQDQVYQPRPSLDRGSSVGSDHSQGGGRYAYTTAAFKKAAASIPEAITENLPGPDSTVGGGRALPGTAPVQRGISGWLRFASYRRKGGAKGLEAEEAARKTDKDVDFKKSTDEEATKKAS